MKKTIMTMALPVPLFLLLVLCSRVTSEPTCTLQGMCGSNENGIVPCTVSKEPHKFEDSSDILSILKDECPELFPKDSSAIPDVCCSPEDLLFLQQTVARIAQVTDACPACSKNLKELLCHFHCAPNQASFLEITKTTPSANGSAIEALTYYVNKKSLESFYKTCSMIPVTKQMVRMAGCEKDCDNVVEFARVMGMRKGMSPFELGIKLVDKGESVTVNGKAGSPVDFLITDCTDSKSCSDSCPSVK